MNIIYRIVNKKKEALGHFPCYYVGSKFNYIPGKYWGSSTHPLLIEELKSNISDFIIEILEYVDKDELTTIELKYQKLFNVVESQEYYNLSYAGEKFTSLNFKWYYCPVTCDKGYFPPAKAPSGWLPGKGPKSNKMLKITSRRTGLKKNSEELKNHISDKVSSKEWVIKGPDDTIHIVRKLHKFCSENNISSIIRRKSYIGKTTKDGWTIIEVRNKKAH